MIKQLGRYEILEELGRGAMGVVRKARDPLIDRFVAIKTIDLNRLDSAEREEYEARFHREARAAGGLNHPNIVTVHDVGASGDVAYMAMELLEGRELKSLIAGDQRLSLDEVLDIAIQVATGLAYAAQHGIVHRDIKPANIMVLPDRRVKIVDFGIARNASALTTPADDTIVGSPSYMSPEHGLNQAVDSRSDIFSLGIVLYQMLTGKRPFAGDSAFSIMYQIAKRDTDRPSSVRSEVPDMLDPVVLKCLAKNPLDRYQSATQLAEDLCACRAKLLNAQSALDRLKRFKKADRPPIHQLIYESRPTSEFTTPELLDILTRSQYKNIRLDLSGLLVFHDGKFMQLLEGGKKEVDELFATIQRDSRHTDVRVVLEADGYYRCMPSWVMGFSTGGKMEHQVKAQDYYIPAEISRQICEAMDSHIGQEFKRFMGL